MSQIQTPEGTSSDLVKSAFETVATYRELVRLNSKETELYPKLLYAMLEFAPCEDGKSYVAQRITRCSSNEDLHDLAREWIDSLLLPSAYLTHYILADCPSPDLVKVQGGRTSVPSSHDSAVAQYWGAHTLSATLEPTTRDRGLMKLNALKRDSYRCMVSKLQDSQHFKKELGGFGMRTEVAHILPFSLNTLKNDQMASEFPLLQLMVTYLYAAQSLQKPRVWEIIEMFSRVRLDELDGQDINRLENILTLSSVIHREFGELNIWLKSVEDKPHCYRLEMASSVGEMFPPIIMPAAGTVVEFTTSDLTDLPLPDPRYLALHAACAQVAHASGAAKYIDELLRDMEDRTVLAEDGSSFKLLDHALSLVNAQRLEAAVGVSHDDHHATLPTPPPFVNLNLFNLIMSLLFKGRSHQLVSVLFDANKRLTGLADGILVGSGLWDAMNADNADLPDSADGALLSISIGLADPRRFRRRIGREGALPPAGDQYKQVTCWAMLDTEIPESSILVPLQWKEMYPLVFPADVGSIWEDTGVDDTGLRSSTGYPHQIPTHQISGVKIPLLTELFAVALSSSAYALAQNSPQTVESWFCSRPTRRILRQGEILTFTQEHQNGNGSTRNGVLDVFSSGPHSSDDQENGDTESMAFSYKYRLLMVEPVLQGYAKVGETRFTVMPADDISGATNDHGQSDLPPNASDPTVQIEDRPPQETETMSSTEYDDDDANAFDIDENFLARSVLNPIPADENVPGASPIGTEEASTSGETAPPSVVQQAARGSGNASAPSFLLRSLDASVNLGKEDEEPAVVVRTRDLGKVGVFSGDWAIINITNRHETRLTRIISDDSLSSPYVAYTSPTLGHNLISAPTLLASSSIIDPSSVHISIRPSPFSSGHPPVPTASSVTIARIASPHASHRSFQPLFLRALKRYFQGKKRLIKKGDLIAVPIWLEQAKLVNTDSSNSGNGENSRDSDTNDKKDKGEDTENELLDYEFALSSSDPSGVVFFKITNLEYDIIDTTNHDSSTIDSYVAATMGELGCWIDPT
ncbi:peroxisomal assembly protein, partial [Tulasnella sp. 403]